MSDLMLRYYESIEAKLSVATQQIGSFEALMDYALMALKGKTACPPNEVAEYISKRLAEIKIERDEKIFGKTI